MKNDKETENKNTKLQNRKIDWKTKTKSNFRELYLKVLGQVPPKNIIPNLGRSLSYLIVFIIIAVMATIWPYEILDNILMGLGMIILAIAEIRAFWSLYLIIDKIVNAIYDILGRLKWKWRGEETVNRLFATNWEKDKESWVLNSLPKDKLQEVNSVYEGIRKKDVTKPINSFKVYNALSNVFESMELKELYNIKDFLGYKKFKVNLFNNISSVFQATVEAMLFLLLPLFFDKNSNFKIQINDISINGELLKKYLDPLSASLKNFISSLFNFLGKFNNKIDIFIIIYLILVILIFFLGTLLRKVRTENIRQLILIIVSRQISIKEKKNKDNSN